MSIPTELHSTHIWLTLESIGDLVSPCRRRGYPPPRCTSVANQANVVGRLQRIYSARPGCHICHSHVVEIQIRR